MNKNGVNDLVGSPLTVLRKLTGLLLMGIGMAIFVIALSINIEVPVVYVKPHNMILLSVVVGILGYYLTEKKIHTLTRVYDLLVWISFSIGLTSFILMFFSRGWWDRGIFLGIFIIAASSYFLFDSLRNQ